LIKIKAVKTKNLSKENIHLPKNENKKKRGSYGWQEKNIGYR
jgi:hypothetical protein